jgi:hypothetical protein
MCVATEVSVNQCKSSCFPSTLWNTSACLSLWDDARQNHKGKRGRLAVQEGKISPPLSQGPESCSHGLRSQGNCLDFPGRNPFLSYLWLTLSAPKSSFQWHTSQIILHSRTLGNEPQEVLQPCQALCSASPIPPLFLTWMKIKKRANTREIKKQICWLKISCPPHLCIIVLLSHLFLLQR